MGADLYINSIHKKCREKYEPLFNEFVEKRNNSFTESDKKKYQKQVSKYYDLMNSQGYFRDSYNGTGILNYLDLSWWIDISKLQDKNGYISPEKCFDFLHIVLSSDLPLPSKERLIENHCQVDETGDNSVEGWHKFLISKRERLINFICLAIESGEGIEASL